MASPDWWADDPFPEEVETSRGYTYEPGLQIAESLVENMGDTDWTFHALCHGMYDVFDLQINQNFQQHEDQKLENNYRARAAQPICFECPVFTECHEDALERLPVGVIQAGARLSSPFGKQREKALLRAHIKWQEHQSKMKRRRIQ